MNGWLLAILVLASYLLGSVSFGRILSAKEKVDVTSQGSGNVGATNMLRTYGAKLGLLTLLLDLLKGVIPAMAGYFVFGGGLNMPESYIALYSCGLGAVVGHIFPIYYKFKGGKAAATACGVFLIAQPVVALCAFVLCVALACITQYVSPMSLLFMLINVVWQNIFMPEFIVMQQFSLAVCLLSIAILVLVFFAHRQNIVRLLTGKERKTDIWGKIFKKDKKETINQNNTEVSHTENSQNTENTKNEENIENQKDD